METAGAVLTQRNAERKRLFLTFAVPTLKQQTAEGLLS
jgi:hypothetical protein